VPLHQPGVGPSSVASPVIVGGEAVVVAGAGDGVAGSGMSGTVGEGVDVAGVVVLDATVGV